MTSTPGPEEDAHLTPAQFRVIREHLGVTSAWLADFFGVGLRSVQRWERGEGSPVPVPRVKALRALEQEAREQIDQIVADLKSQARTSAVPAVQTYPSDESYRQHTGGPWSAGWHRAVTGRAIETYGRPATVAYPQDGAAEKRVATVEHGTP